MELASARAVPAVGGARVQDGAGGGHLAPTALLHRAAVPPQAGLHELARGEHGAPFALHLPLVLDGGQA